MPIRVYGTTSAKSAGLFERNRRDCLKLKMKRQKAKGMVAYVFGAFALALVLLSSDSATFTAALWRPPLGGPAVVRLKPDTTYGDFFTGSSALRSQG